MEGIIFDMDNTLLQSKIDFYRMKKEVFQFLLSHGMISPDMEWQSKTPSQIIEIGRPHHQFKAIESQLWQVVEEVEADGMRDVQLEPYAKMVVEELKEKNKTLTVLTNNARRAAVHALKCCEVYDLFDYVAGREQMKELKPSPSGIMTTLERYPTIDKENWVMVGDSWIDGMAAKQAGISFIAYQASKEALTSREIHPLAFLQTLAELPRWV